jgi:hypothetical protein
MPAMACIASDGNGRWCILVYHGPVTEKGNPVKRGTKAAAFGPYASFERAKEVLERDGAKLRDDAARWLEEHREDE